MNQNNEANSDYMPKEYVHRKALSQLIYKKIENVKLINDAQYKEIVNKYPVLSQLYQALRDFYEIIFSKATDRIEEWIEKTRKYDIPVIQTFCNGLSKDIEAVKNGIRYSYNNGIAEGSVNKIKLIKKNNVW